MNTDCNFKVDKITYLITILVIWLQMTLSVEQRILPQDCSINSHLSLWPAAWSCVSWTTFLTDGSSLKNMPYIYMYIYSWFNVLIKCLEFTEIWRESNWERFLSFFSNTFLSSPHSLSPTTGILGSWCYSITLLTIYSIFLSLFSLCASNWIFSTAVSSSSIIYIYIIFLLWCIICYSLHSVSFSSQRMYISENVHIFCNPRN
jgi:hypothetical protein